ncbi:hypothetical protein HLV35_00855 [Eggerthellaceae bacterium zg-997]|nr:hypothetical protein [Eggerthellaceae bacterium zg-997]
MLLVRDGNKAAMTDFVRPHRDEIELGFILGGTAAVSENLALALELAVSGN